MVWVTARESDTLLAFFSRRPGCSAILRGPGWPTSRWARRRWAWPWSTAARRLVAADSDRFSLRGAQANLAVVSVAAALAHRPALLGYVKSGLFPRQMALEPGGRTLLVTDFASHQLEAVSVAGLP